MSPTIASNAKLRTTAIIRSLTDSPCRVGFTERATAVSGLRIKIDRDRAPGLYGASKL